MLTQEVITKYKELRQDHISRYTGTGHIYHYKVRAERALSAAKHIVSTNQRWEKAETAGLVRLRTEPDELYDLDDLAGDTYNPEVNSDIQPHILEREYKEFVDQVNNEGVWVLFGEYKCTSCGQWIWADSVGGFVGDDWEGSGYDLDIMNSTLEFIGE